MFKRIILMTVVLLLLYGGSQAQNKNSRLFMTKKSFAEAWFFAGTATDDVVDINFFGITGSIRQSSEEKVKRLFGVEAAASKYQYKSIDSAIFQGTGEGREVSIGATWERLSSSENKLKNLRFSFGGEYSTRKSDSKTKMNNHNYLLTQHDVEESANLYAKLRYDLHLNQLSFSRMTFDLWYETQVYEKGKRALDTARSSFKPNDRSNYGVSLEVGMLSFPIEIFSKSNALTFSVRGDYEKRAHQNQDRGQLTGIVSFWNGYSDIIRVSYGIGINLKRDIKNNGVDNNLLNTFNFSLDIFNTCRGFFN